MRDHPCRINSNPVIRIRQSSIGLRAVFGERAKQLRIAQDCLLLGVHPGHHFSLGLGHRLLEGKATSAFCNIRRMRKCRDGPLQDLLFPNEGLAEGGPNPGGLPSAHPKPLPRHLPDRNCFRSCGLRRLENVIELQCMLSHARHDNDSATKRNREFPDIGACAPNEDNRSRSSALETASLSLSQMPSKRHSNAPA